MRRGIPMLLCLLACLPAWAADPQRIIKLEQDMRNLERRVQDQAQEIERLRRQLGQAAARTPARPAPEAPDASAAWLRATNWDRVSAGMGEFDVIDILGPPTSVRPGEEENTRVLLYAMEIGASAFLSGSVRLEDGRVVDVQKPMLR